MISKTVGKILDVILEMSKDEQARKAIGNTLGTLLGTGLKCHHRLIWLSEGEAKCPICGSVFELKKETGG